MKSWIVLALVLVVPALSACEAKPPAGGEPAVEAAQGQVVTLAISGMT